MSGRVSWAVAVEHGGETILTIGSDFLSGKPEFSDEEAQCIRDCARNLLGFIGEPPGERPDPQGCATCAEAQALIEAVHDAIEGRPVNEFMESFPTVRLVMDLRDRAVASEAALKAPSQAETEGPMCRIHPEHQKPCPWCARMHTPELGGRK